MIMAFLMYSMTVCTVAMLILLRGQGGVPRVHIMENEFGYLFNRGGHGGHLAEKFLKKYFS